MSTESEKLLKKGQGLIFSFPLGGKKKTDEEEVAWPTREGSFLSNSNMMSRVPNLFLPFT
jgi:hypothetical protein